MDFYLSENACSTPLAWKFWRSARPVPACAAALTPAPSLLPRYMVAALKSMPGSLHLWARCEQGMGNVWAAQCKAACGSLSWMHRSERH